MPDREGRLDLEGLQTSLFFETPEEIYARVFRQVKPRTPMPDLRVEFCRFANADSFIRLEEGRLDVRISDLLAGAPAPVMEALAFILISKLYRMPVARQHAHRYRLYLNRREFRRQAQVVRQIRGRKYISGPQGEHHNLEQIFEALNVRFFDGLMGYVPTERSSEVRMGLDVDLTDNSGKVLEKTKIAFISPEVDSTLQGILVKAPVQSGSNVLRNAQMVKARIIWSTKPMAVVPVLAVMRQGGQTFVFVAQQQNGHFMAVQTAVTLGDTVGNTYAILSGLNPGDRVIVSGTQFLVNGMPVMPMGG